MNMKKNTSEIHVLLVSEVLDILMKMKIDQTMKKITISQRKT